jgi:zinc protease
MWKAFGRAMLAAGMVLAAGTATAAEDAPLLPKPGFAHERSDIAVDPAVRYGTLPNGLRYAILRNQTPPGVISVRLRAAVGSLHERDDQSGLAHFLEHMAFNGSKNIPEGDMVKILEREGLAFGPDTNAYTSFGETVYMLDLPNNRPQLFELALKIMRETASNLTMSDGAIERERGVIVAEERARATPSFRMFEDYLKFAMAGTRTPTRFPIGSMDVVRTAPRDRFVELYQGYYRPETALVVVTGDIDPAAAEKAITAAFGDWKAEGAPGPQPDLGAPKAAPGAARVFVDPQVPTVIWVTQARAEPELPDTVANREAEAIRSLGEAVLNRRLERIARRPGAPFLSASVGRFNYDPVNRAAQLQIVTEPGKWQAGLSAAEAELRRALEHGFGAAEVAQELANFEEGARAAAAEAGTRQTRGLAMGLVGAFDDGNVFSHPETNLKIFEGAKPKMTAEAALAALRKVWDGPTPTVFLASSQAPEGGEAALSAAFAAARATPVAAPDEAAAVTWGYTDFGPAGRVVSRAPVRVLPGEVVTFGNNVRLVMKPSDFEDDTVRIQVRVGQGELELPRDRAGLAFAISSAFTAGGLGKHDESDLERALAGRSVGVNFGVGDDAYILSGATRPKDLELQLQLMAAYVTDPAYRPDGFVRTQASFETILKNTESSPSAVAGAQLGRVLQPGDARDRFPTRDEWSGIAFEDVVRTVRPALQSGAIEVTMVGAFKPEEAIALVGKTFGAVPQRRPGLLPLAESRAQALPAPTPTPVSLTHKGRADQALAMVFWPAPDFSDPRRARLARLVSDIMGLRLTDEVREKQGATYSPSAGWQASSISPGYGLVSASSEVTPDGVDRFIATAEGIAAAMAKGDITQDELLRARKPLIEGLRNDRRSNPTWMGRLAGGAFRPDQWPRAASVEADYNAATLAQVRAMARELFDPAKAVRIKIVPEAPAKPEGNAP